jgi:hypothetical protein
MNTRTFALALGIALILAGVAGFIPGLVTQGPHVAGAAPAAGVSFGYLLGLFPVNGLHNLVHIAWGLYGVLAWRSLRGAQGFAKASTVVYGALVVLGLLPGLNTLFGVIPLFGHDVWLHALIAIASAYFGFARAVEAEPAGGATAGRPRV